MINAIADLGKYVKEKNPEMDILDIILDDIYEAKKDKKIGKEVPNYPYIILISLEKIDESNWRYKGIDIKENHPSLSKKILYFKKRGSGADFTPTTKFTDLKKTFYKRTIGWFEKNNSVSKSEFLNSIYKALIDSQEKIFYDLKNITKDITDGKFLTLQFIDDKEKKLIGDYEEFNSLTLESGKLKFKYKHNAYSYSQNKICSICNKEKDEIFGFYDEYSHSSDKMGMITGGFKLTESWKNYPVCYDCIRDLENGRKLLKKCLTFNFYGFRYYLIPKFNIDISNNLKYNIINWIIDLRKNVRFNNVQMSQLTDDENEILEELSKKNANMYLDFLFFREDPNTKAFSILLDLKDILPSRLSKLFEIKKNIDKVIFFKDAKSKKDEPLCYFNFGLIKNIFPFYYEKQEFRGHYKDYLSIVDKIFKGKKINYVQLIHFIINRIRLLFVNNENEIQDKSGFQIGTNTFKRFEVSEFHIKNIVISMFMVLVYLDKLNLFKKNNQEVKMDKQFFEEFKIQTKEEFENKVDLFFNNFKDFFQTDAHRGTFLMGVLTQLLLEIQAGKRDGATPFRSKLKGLKMNSYDISVLLSSVTQKLTEYDRSNAYLPLKELVSKFIISAGNYKNWRLPIDEMNFIFVLGMNLSNYFKIKSEEIEEKQND